MKKNNDDARSVWINDAQIDFISSIADFNVNVWGRGTGKTTVLGIQHYRRHLALPGAKFFLTAPTYKNILNNCLPPIEDFWRSVGLEEYDWKAKRGHYVIGQKPPSHFEKPFKAPKHFEHIITFYNGYTVEMMSMDRPSPNRGGSFDGGDADELALIKKDYLEQNMIPMIRGNTERFGESHPLHGKFSGFTSMPWLASGQYVLDYEDKAKEDPATFHYSEATAECNLRVLGKDWIKKQEKFLSPEVFDIEIMNQRRKSAESMFYHSFSESKHVYIPSISYRDDPVGRGIMVDQSSDYNPEQLIDVTFDFGGWFTCALLFQQTHERKDSTRTTERMIDSFFVQKGGSAENVVDMIVERYRGQRIKYVRLWGEPRANDPTAHGRTLYQVVEARFRSHGWMTEVKVFVSQAHSHDQRFAYMNDMLAENKNLPKLRCNRDTCKAPIMAIQFAERTHDLKKDKSKEKDRAFDQRHATHFTDALDYYFMQKHFKRVVGMGLSAWTS